MSGIGKSMGIKRARWRASRAARRHARLAIAQTANRRRRYRWRRRNGVAA